MAFVPLLREAKLHDGHRSVHRHAGRVLLLLQVAGERFLCDAHCPHMGVLLSSGSIDGLRLRCPGHGLTFDLRTGDNVEGLCQPLRRLPVVHAGGRVGFEA
jgi:nitrite reductase/ring-hydroxylating ferredoxin subunit